VCERYLMPVEDPLPVSGAAGEIDQPECLEDADGRSRSVRQPRSQARCLPIGRYVDRPAGFDVHEGGPAAAALSGGVLVDASHPRSGHFRLGSGVDRSQDCAAADRRA
jgi:hypothetical protein